MKDFESLWKEFEGLDAEAYEELIAEKADTIVPALGLAVEDEESGITRFFNFVFGAINADGKLSKKEFELISPILYSLFGNDADYEICRDLFLFMCSETEEEDEPNEIFKTPVELADIFRKLPEDVKNDLILVCLMICAIDGKISPKEKQWLEQIMQ